MSQSRLTCPNCHAAIGLPADGLDSAHATCPRCGSALTIPPVDNDSAAGAERIAAYSIIAGTLVLLFGIAVGLATVCFSGEGSAAPAEVVLEDDFDDSVLAAPPTKKKALPRPRSKSSLVDLTAEEENKVKLLADRGVAYLKARQNRIGAEAGSWPSNLTQVGTTALAGLTLLESGLPPEDSAVQSAAAYVRLKAVEPATVCEAYAVSLSILFLARMNLPEDRILIRSLALRLISSQHATGGWSYEAPPLTPAQEAELLTRIQTDPAPLTKAGDSPFVFIQRAFPIVGTNDYNPPSTNKYPDNSNTQFALLALWAARPLFDREQIDRPLRLVAKRFRDSQSPIGTWAYAEIKESNSSRQLPTMTAAGLLGLAVGYGLDIEAQGNDPAKHLIIGDAMVNDQALRSGFRVLANRIGAPGDKTHVLEMYFLWSIERVAVLYNLPQIEGKDWYRWGLEFLVANQKNSGEWNLHIGEGSSDIVDTCFALLFLNRANLSQDLTEKIEALTAALAQLHRKKN